MNIFDDAKTYMNRLSEQQQAGAFEFENPAMVIACPGSGKTTMLTGRLIRLLLPKEEGGNGVDPSSILMLTFTNKAAREMEERAAVVLEPLRNAGIEGRPSIGTFHGIARKILMIEANQVGLDLNFTILDEEDAKSLVKEVVEEMGIEAFDYHAFREDIEKAKGQVLSPQILKMQRDRLRNMPAGRTKTAFDLQWEERLDQFGSANFFEIYLAYQEELERQNSVDFSDLINHVTNILRDHPKVRDSWRATFRHILVDEAQDLNESQLAFLQEITGGLMNLTLEPDARFSRVATAFAGNHDVHIKRAAERGTLFFVADDDQSIYGWRGARGRGMLGDIIKSFPEMPEQPFYLEHNHRSPPAVLKFSESMIRHNPQRFDKSIKPANPARDDSPVCVFQYDTWEDEIKALAKQVGDYMAKGGAPSDFGILCRTRNGVRAIAKILREYGLPVTEGKTSDIRNTAEFRDIMAWCNTFLNPQSDQSLRRIVNLPARGMGKSSMSKAAQEAQRNGRSLREELAAIMNDRIEPPQNPKDGYTKAFVNATKEFGKMFVKIRADLKEADNAADAMMVILRGSGYYQDKCKDALAAIGINEKHADYQRLVDLDPRSFVIEAIMIKNGQDQKFQTALEESDPEDLVETAGRQSEALRRIGNLAIMVEQASRHDQLLEFVQQSTLEMSADNEMVGARVMTIHASKGLEFPHVRLPFWGEGIFPNGMKQTPEEEAEERNMAFVAATRAEDTLEISFPRSIGKCAFYFGDNRRNVRPSQYVTEGMEYDNELKYVAIYDAGRNNNGKCLRRGAGRGGEYSMERKAPKVKNLMTQPDQTNDYGHSPSDGPSL